jgi:hypothetical protein
VYVSVPSLQCIGDVLLDLTETVAHVDLSLSICYGAKIIATELRLIEKSLYRISVYLVPRQGGLGKPSPPNTSGTHKSTIH